MKAVEPGIRWCVVRGSTPEWSRSAALDEHGTVYLPAALADDERSALLRAAWDGNVTMIEDSGHIYLPASWLAREYRDLAATFDRITAQVVAHFEP